VKLTFPPRPRAKWLLITIRLSTINFAGTARTEVAVGISKLASIFVTTRAEVPFNFSITSSVSEAGAGFAAAVASSAAWFTVGVGAAVVPALGLAAGSEPTEDATGAADVVADFAAEAIGEYSLGE
jgi:hypothetical protein